MTIAAAEGLRRPGAPGWEPERDAGDDRGHCEGAGQEGITPQRRKAAAPGRLRTRLHKATVFSVLLAVQIAWLTALVYGIWAVAP